MLCVEGVSEQLVRLLEERHDLRQQIDMRHIAVQQLTRLHAVTSSDDRDVIVASGAPTSAAAVSHCRGSPWGKDFPRDVPRRPDRRTDRRQLSVTCGKTDNYEHPQAQDAAAAAASQSTTPCLKKDPNSIDRNL